MSQQHCRFIYLFIFPQSKAHHSSTKGASNSKKKKRKRNRRKAQHWLRNFQVKRQVTSVENPLDNLFRNFLYTLVETRTWPIHFYIYIYNIHLYIYFTPHLPPMLIISRFWVTLSFFIPKLTPTEIGIKKHSF